VVSLNPSVSNEAIKCFFEAMIVEGKENGCFDPKGTATRVEVAAMLHRLLEVTQEKR
jgi:hypothetical protein